MHGPAIARSEHELVTARDGREALALLAGSGPFDVVLLDLNMPVVNGIEFMRELRGRQPVAGTPLIVIAAGAEASPVHREACGMGAMLMVRKPRAPRDIGPALDAALPKAS